MATVFVDACNGLCFAEYYDDSATCDIMQDSDAIQVKGNRSFLSLLAKQMIYFASNDFCLPFGSHIHYDSFNHIGHHGLDLVLEVVRTQEHDIVLDSEEGIYVQVDVPRSADKLWDYWRDDSKVCVKSSDQSVYLLGNACGLMFIATVLLFMVERGEPGYQFSCTEQLLNGWQGQEMSFAIVQE